MWCNVFSYKGWLTTSGTEHDSHQCSCWKWEYYLNITIIVAKNWTFRCLEDICWDAQFWNRNQQQRDRNRCWTTTTTTRLPAAEATAQKTNPQWTQPVCQKQPNHSQEKARPEMINLLDADKVKSYHFLKCLLSGLETYRVYFSIWVCYKPIPPLWQQASSALRCDTCWTKDFIGQHIPAGEKSSNNQTCSEYLQAFIKTHIISF